MKGWMDWEGKGAKLGDAEAASGRTAGRAAGNGQIEPILYNCVELPFPFAAIQKTAKNSIVHFRVV
jgi:hypothetical protein